MLNKSIIINTTISLMMDNIITSMASAMNRFQTGAITYSNPLRLYKNSIFMRSAGRGVVMRCGALACCWNDANLRGDKVREAIRLRFSCVSRVEMEL